MYAVKFEYLFQYKFKKCLIDKSTYCLQSDIGTYRKELDEFKFKIDFIFNIL